MNRDKVAASWRHYLGSATDSPYAAPPRVADLSRPAARPSAGWTAFELGTVLRRALAA